MRNSLGLLSFCQLRKGEKRNNPRIQKCVMSMYGVLARYMNDGLIDDYNKWFAENVFDGDMSKDEKMLVLYDAGLSAWVMNAVGPNGRFPIHNYTESPHGFGHDFWFTNIDLHRASYTVMDTNTGCGMEMVIGKVRPLD